MRTRISSKTRSNEHRISANVLRYIFSSIYLILFIPSFISKSLEIPHWYTISTILILVFSIYQLAQILSIIRISIFSTSLLLLFIFPIFVTIAVNQSLIFESLTRFVRAYGFFIFIVYLHTKYGIVNAIRILFFSLLIVLGINCLSMIIHPEGLYRTQTDGILETTVKNEPGYVRNNINHVHWLLGHQTTIIRYILPALLFTCLFYCISVKGKPSKTETICIILMIIICIIQAVIANSASNYIGIVLLFVLLIARRFKLTINPVLIISIAFVLYYLVNNLDNSALLQYLSDFLNRPVKLSTRTPIWEAAIEYIAKSPIFGYGFIDENSLYIRSIFGLGNPHSTYLWALFEGGIIEFGILIALIYSAYNGTANSGNALYSDVCYAAVITLLVLMITDDYIFRDVFFILTLYAAYSCKQYSQALTKAESVDIEKRINSIVSRKGKKL